MHEIVLRFHKTDVPDPLFASWVGVHMTIVCLLLDHGALWFQTLPYKHTVFSWDVVTQGLFCAMSRLCGLCSGRHAVG